MKHHLVIRCSLDDLEWYCDEVVGLTIITPNPKRILGNVERSTAHPTRRRKPARSGARAARLVRSVCRSSPEVSRYERNQNGNATNTAISNTNAA
jgi:hypothetical protein